MVDVLRSGPPDRKRSLPPWLPWTVGAVAVVTVLAVGLSRPLGASLEGSPTPHPAPTALTTTVPAGPPTGVTPADGETPGTTTAPGPATAEGTTVPAPLRCPGPPRDRGGADASTDGPAVALLLPATPGASLDRRDPTAESGPHSVVVRRADGSLGRHGAVVTVGVPARPAGARVQVGGVTGRAAPHQVSWPIAESWARVRGDLAQSVLVRIATSTRVVAGRPRVAAPRGYSVVGTGSYRPAHVREVRYLGEPLGNSLLGLTYTGVTGLAGFEDQLYAVGSTSCGKVHGSPAVLSSVRGGSATVAWQVGSDQVGYVGYSGGEPDAPTLLALGELAGRSRAIDDRQWRGSHPQVVLERNDPG